MVQPTTVAKLRKKKQPTANADLNSVVLWPIDIGFDQWYRYCSEPHTACEAAVFLAWEMLYRDGCGSV